MGKLRPCEGNDLPKVMSLAGYRAGVRAQEPDYSSYTTLQTQLTTKRKTRVRSRP